VAIYDQIRAKIEELNGTAGPIGSLNLKGGTEIRIKYNTPSGYEEHDIVPYLIGESSGTGNGTVKRLIAHKYTGTTTHPKKGWRCYKVEEINSILSVQDQRPNGLPKLKLNRQICVEDW
jgi:hypothetical protein